jgi:hypothetical protein
MAAGASGAEVGDQIMNTWVNAIDKTIKNKQGRDQLELDEAKRSDANRHFDVNADLARRGLEQGDRSQGMNGMQMLANSRTQAQQQANLSGFRNGLVNLYS